ncbi:MAG: glycosyltransferase family A protein [Parachlamydiales bacterium]|jgi:glycosyltransferase involved in cell wall biosynthesis
MLIAPEISVVISTYNRNHPSRDCASLFQRAVDSILNQTFFDFELILINDASHDGTHDLCLKYAAQDCRVKYVCHEKNTQLPARCYNEGMGLSRGRYIAFMFDDDMWLPTTLHDLYTFFESSLKELPNLGMVYGQTQFNDTATNTILNPQFGLAWDLNLLHTHNLLANCAVLLKKEVIEVVGGYDEDPVMRRICDWDLWQRIGRMYSVLFLPKLVASVYQNQPDSIGSLVVLDRKQVRKRQKSNRKLPLQIRNPTIWQRIRSALTFFHIHFPVSKKYKHYEALCVPKMKYYTKKFLQTIGCWKLAKTVYDRIKT